MWRIILEPAALFLSPFLAYALYLTALRRYPLAVAHWSRGTLSALAFSGLVIAVGGTLVFGLRAERHLGVYVPAHVQNGQLMPGHME